MLRAERSGRHEDSAWDGFVAGHTHGHLLQSSAWGRFRANWGWSAGRVVVRDDAGAIVAGAQALQRSTPAGKITYVPRGPVCEPDDRAWPELRAALDGIARPGLALRIEPGWRDDADTRRRLADWGFVEAEAIQPPSTIRLSLDRSEDQLLSGMKQKWRYNIGLAQRRGVAVDEGGPSDMAAFGALMRETAARDGFGARPTEYFADLARCFGSDAHVYFARLGGELLAAILVLHFGATATYLYGASGSHGRRHMPNHILQWVAITQAREAGLRWYDFWGIPDEIGCAVVAGGDPEAVEQGTGGLWGVWGFKRGFGGQVGRSVGAWDLVYSPIRYRLAHCGAMLRRRLAGAR